MDEDSDPMPETPKGRLWASLGLPALVTLVGSLIAGWLAKGGDRFEFLFVLPFGALAILVGYLMFSSVWRGESVYLISFCYLIGQLILCTGVWFGCCIIS